jgi:hypothetical protein
MLSINISVIVKGVISGCILTVLALYRNSVSASVKGIILGPVKG